MSDAAPALRIRHASKAYPGVVALDDVSFDVARGTVHGLVGSNGSGKSTLVRVLAGAHAPDPPTAIDVLGAPLRMGDAAAARAAGIVAVHQDPAIVGELTVLENAFVGCLPTRRGIVDTARCRRELNAAMERSGIRLPPRAIARRLSVGDRMRLQILRALLRDARVLLLDEPTAALGPADREALYGVMQTLTAQGVTQVFVSHDLDEVLAVSDAVTVLRDGRHVATSASAQWTRAAVVEAMLEHSLEQGAAVAGGHRRASTAPPLLEVERLAVGPVREASFAVAPGEVVGLAGLAGSGRSQLLRTLCGAQHGSAGGLRVRGRAAAWPRSVRQGLRLGIGLVTEDRRATGLVASLDARENALMTGLGRVASCGVVRRRRASAAALRVLRSTGYRYDPGRNVATLSGGNQQKVVLAKWFYRAPEVLLVDEPTAGVDVGAKAEIWSALRSYADAGRAVLVVSSDFDELATIADRALVLARGRIVEELPGGSLSKDRLTERVFAADAGGAR